MIWKYRFGGSEAAPHGKDAVGLGKRGGRREGSKRTQTKTILSCFELLSLPFPTQLMFTSVTLSASHQLYKEKHKPARKTIHYNPCGTKQIPFLEELFSKELVIQRAIQHWDISSSLCHLWKCLFQSCSAVSLSQMLLFKQVPFDHTLSDGTNNITGYILQGFCRYQIKSCSSPAAGEESPF